MNWVTATLVGLGIGILTANCLVGQEPTGRYFVFLVSGEPATDLPRDEVEKMQAQHLDNFRALTEQGTLLAVGPCVDPEKKIRGIVVLRGKSKEAIEQLFVNDPFIAEGWMKLDVVSEGTTMGKLQPKFDPATLEEVSIAVVRREDSWSELNAEQQAQAWAEHKAWTAANFADGTVGYAAEFPDDPQRLGVLILRANEKSIIALAAR